MKSSLQPIIGLEVHIELKTKSKMFCSCINEHFNVAPNTNVCPVCLGLPGALPVANKEAIEQTIIIALAFNCSINQSFWFDRKNYFYPDLPKGYQISQHFCPIGIGGGVPIAIDDIEREIELSDLHLEEDTGKSIHKDNNTFLDFNRSGVPLVEIVSQPQLKSAIETKAYLKRIRQTIRWLGLSDCDMEKGSMRLEANISLQEKKLAEKGILPEYKVEIKNLNSFRFVEKAIEYEIKRQTQILNRGQTPKQETRGFDAKKRITFPQRGKEASKDYRYFPEPDIPPFDIDNKTIKKLRSKVKDLPWQKEKKLVRMGVSMEWAKIICQNKKRLTKFEAAVKLGKKEGIYAKKIANKIVNKPNPKQKAQDIVNEIKKDLNKFSLNKKEISQIIAQVIKENPEAVDDFKSGKTQVMGFFIGQVQIRAKGKADPKIIAQKIIQSLKK